MATARRVIYSTHVSFQESLSLEEGATKYRVEGGTGRSYGGKGIATTTATQWGEGWVSTTPQWDLYGSNWEDSSQSWDEELTVSGVLSLNPDSGTASNPVKFLYIKNLGTASNQRLKVSLDGTNYKINIPPKGSISLRGDGTTLQMEDVKVNKVDQNTTIEFVIAK